MIIFIIVLIIVAVVFILMVMGGLESYDPKSDNKGFVSNNISDLANHLVSFNLLILAICPRFVPFYFSL